MQRNTRISTEIVELCNEKLDKPPQPTKMKVRISDNVNGENRHVNATPKGIDNHSGRDNSSCAEVKCTAVSHRIAYAEQLSAQAPLLVDCRKDLNQVRVRKGGVDIQEKSQTHKNLKDRKSVV